MKHYRFFFVALLLAFFIVPSYADENAIYGSYTHVLGLYDTKSDARVLCYSGLVKSLCQRVAATLSRYPAMASSGTTKEEVAASLPFLLRVEVTGESFGVHGDDISVSMSGRAAVDAGAIALALTRMKSDEPYRAEVAAGLEKFARLEKDVRSRQARISSEIAGAAIAMTASPVLLASSQPAGASPVAAASASGAAVIAASGAAQASSSLAPQDAATVSSAVQPARPAIAPQASDVPILAGAPPVAAAAQAARKNESSAFPMVFPTEAPEALFSLRSGMSYKDMLETVGAPAQRSECGNKVYYNYANVWVYFNDGELVGYLMMENWKGPCHPYVGFMGEILYF